MLFKYESEWYSEIDSKGKMPKWEALNEQMSSEAQSYLDFLNDQQDKKVALAKLEQNQRQLFNDTKTAQTKESEAAKADQQPLPSLSVDGKAWYLHPVGVMDFVNISIVRNYTVNDAKEALRIIYNKYGKEMAIIVEKMYRAETNHFKSGQYIQTGTG